VLGSRLRLRRYRDIASFLRAALKVRAQVRASEGAVGVSLIAQPAAKTFWTLSAWTDQDALDAFVRSSPHREVMARFHEALSDPLFTTWKESASDLPTKHSNAKQWWTEAKRRLAAENPKVHDQGAIS
jgi:quinol monooxygenase YgiN